MKIYHIVVFKHEIFRKKIRGKKGIIVRETCQMSGILYLYLIARVCVNNEDAF